MPKLGPIFLLATSIIILLCFGVLCYLMKTVNPKPIPENARRYNSLNIPYAEELSQSGNLEYGLEKLPENVTINATNLYTKSNTRSFSSDDGFVEPPVSPNSTNNSRIDAKNINAENKTDTTNSILSHIRGQRRSIKDDDEFLNLIKMPNSLILNLREHDGPKIIIQLGAESINKRGKKRSSSKRRSDFNKTVVVLDVNDSILLNVIGNTVDVNTLDEVEPTMIKNKLEFEKTTYNNLSDDLINDLMKSKITEENIANSSSFSTAMFSNDKTDTEYNRIDGIENDPTYTSTEKFNFIDTIDITSTMKLETTTVMNDLVVDLLMQGETLKDSPPRNKNMYENGYVT